MKYRKTSQAQADRVDENLVVMNGATMKCFLLNEMAAVLWDALDHYGDHDALVALLAEADVADAGATVDRLAAELLEAGLIEPCPA